MNVAIHCSCFFSSSAKPTNRHRFRWPPRCNFRTVARSLALCLMVMVPFQSFSQSCTISTWDEGGDAIPDPLCHPPYPFSNATAVFACVIGYFNSLPPNSKPANTVYSYAAGSNSGTNATATLIATNTVTGVVSYGNPNGLTALKSQTPETGSQCAAAPASPKDAGQSCQLDGECGDPIVMSIGNKVLEEVDFVAPGPNPLQFVRYYNSSPVASSAFNFAQGWMHNYAISVNSISSSSVVVTRPDGKAITFNLSGGKWTPDADVSDTLVQLLSGSTVIGWQYTRASDDALEIYDQYGNLSAINYREGTTVTLKYVTTNGVPTPTFPAQLLSVTDSFGKTLGFSSIYNANTNSYTQLVTDPNNETFTYTLGSIGQLSSVTYPDTTSKTYLYNEPSYTGGLNIPWALTGVIDEDNARYDSTWYGPGGVAAQTSLAGGVGDYTPTNSQLDSTGRIQTVSLLNPLGATLKRGFTTAVGRNRLSSATEPAVNGSPLATKSFGFDANGNVAQIIDYNGNLNCFVYIQTSNLEQGRVEGMAPGSTCPTTISTYVPRTGTVERKLLTTWHAVWHLPIERAEPLKITTWAYNGDGGVYCAPTTAKVGSNPIGVLCTRTEQPTTDKTGGSGYSATPTGSPRVWKYTYNSLGQVLTAEDPLTNVTKYSYYTCTTGQKCGQIYQIENAALQYTTFNTYDGNGRPLTITDPNNVTTTLTYDGRSRLTETQISAANFTTEITTYAPTPTGQLHSVSLPDSSTVIFTYNQAHQLTKIADTLSNFIVYTPDAMGDNTLEQWTDPSNNLKRSYSRGFNTLAELYQGFTSIGSLGTTTYGYDGNGNLKTIDAPLTRDTTKNYDALNRLDQITDPNNGVTNLVYDGRDNLTKVIDPNTYPTSYTNDAFGDVTLLASPDTGTTQKGYDLAGNLKTSIDARGANDSNYYDALNRLTKQVYSDQTIIFSYDSPSVTNGIGRLTGASDANHSMTWGYDAAGRVTSKSVNFFNVVTKTVNYSYLKGDLITMTTPSGQTITYEYANTVGINNHSITGIKINGAFAVEAVTNDPFGPVISWEWGNAQPVTRSYTTDGFPDIFTINGIVNTYSPDDALRIQEIQVSSSPSNVWTYEYDVLDRVTSTTSTASPVINQGYKYDANGNRILETGSAPQTITLNPGTNQLFTSVGGPGTFHYDAAGNTTSTTISGGGFTATYNQRGRMSTIVSSAGTTTYYYNALGQLFYKGGVGGPVGIMYDERGHIIGEYTSTGALIEETVWIDDIPVATILPSGNSVQVYYIHTDHLGTPRKITQAQNGNLVWTWDPNSFGSSAANGNPGGGGVFTYNLRFPGTYFQSESALLYNDYRDYIPSTGTYVESDPIGLAGGSYSTYAYVGGNPISRVDPSGLATWYAGTSGAGAFGPWGVTGGEGSYYDTTMGKAGFYNFNGDAKGLILDAGYNFGFQTGNSCDFKGASKYVTIDIVFFSVSLVSNSTSWGLNFGAGIGLGYGFGTTNTDIHPR